MQSTKQRCIFFKLDLSCSSNYCNSNHSNMPLNFFIMRRPSLQFNLVGPCFKKRHAFYCQILNLADSHVLQLTQYGWGWHPLLTAKANLFYLCLCINNKLIYSASQDEISKAKNIVHIHIPKKKLSCSYHLTCICYI